MRKLFLLAVLILFSTTSAIAAEVLPFGVKIAGQVAKQLKDSHNFATIAAPVSNNAELEADIEAEKIVVTVFPSDEKGNSQGKLGAIIMIQGGKTAMLDKTLTQNTLEPGTYLMTVAAEGKTARVLFKVE